VLDVNWNDCVADAHESEEIIMASDDIEKDTRGARMLGWASIGIGLAELAAPQQVENLMGLPNDSRRQGILRVLGVRELMHGLSILAEKEPDSRLATGVGSRVVGDVLDTALFATVAKKTNHPVRYAAVGAALLGIGALDALFAARLLRDQDGHGKSRSRRYSGPSSVYGEHQSPRSRQPAMSGW
jgi:hypothetical protein